MNTHRFCPTRARVIISCLSSRPFPFPAAAAAAAAITLMTAAPAVAGEARIYIAPQYVMSHLSGEATVSGGESLPGTEFDLEDTLGVDPDVTAGTIEGFLKFLGTRLSFGYSHTNTDGEAVLDDPLVFDGEPFIPGERIRTEIDMKRYKLLFGYDFSLKVVNAGFLVGAHLIDIEGDIDSLTLPHNQTADLNLPVPAVGGTLGIHPLGWLAIHGELTGMSANISGVRTKLIDGYAGVDFLFAAKAGIGIGYRYFVLDGEDEDEGNAVDIVQRGVYASVSVHL